jgi:hypothetical protein
LQQTLLTDIPDQYFPNKRAGNNHVVHWPARSLDNSFYLRQELLIDFDFVNVRIIFLASSILNDMFTHFEQLRYLDFYTLTKLSVILPHGVCKLTRKEPPNKLLAYHKVHLY